MKNDLKYIDDIYKAGLSNLTAEAGGSLWRKLYVALLWMRYKWFFIIGGIVLIVGLTGYAFYGNSVSTPVQLTGKHAIAEKTMQKPDNNLSVTELPVTGKRDASHSLLPKNNITTQTTNPGKETLDFNDSESHTANNLEKADSPMAVHKLPYQTQLDALTIKTVLTTQPDSIVFGANRITPHNMHYSKQNGFYIDMFGGPALNHQVISGYDAEYLDYRNNHEQSSTGWSAGAEVKYQFKQWSIGTGLLYSVYRQYRDYQHINHVYNPDNSYYNYDTTWMWVYDPPVIGKPIVKNVDSTWVKVYDEHKIDHSGYNEISYFEIPLTVGYRFSSNQFVVELSMGASVGFVHRSVFKVPDFNNYQNITDVTDVNTVMFNYIASATFYYQLSEKVWLIATPCYKQNLRSVFNKTYPVNERFNTFGLNLGVSFRLY